jgi:undecaprenyl-diphosphatase
VDLARSGFEDLYVNYLEAALLGGIQGLTEFLPVSSSGHLALAQYWMRLQPESPPMILFDVAAHVGTLLAVVAVFWRTFARYLVRLAKELKPAASPTGSRPLRPWLVRNVACRVLILGIVASVSTAVIRACFKHQLEAAFGNPVLIGVAFLITGVFLFASGIAPTPSKPWRRFGVPGAILVGIAQGAAITPGISRSGATICTAILCGLKSRWAAEFSFFIAFPAICGAALLKAKDVFEMPAGQLAGVPRGSIVLGSVVAAVVGYFALRMLLAAVRRAKLIYFSYYVWAVGILVIVLALTGNLRETGIQGSSSLRMPVTEGWTGGPPASASAARLTVLGSTTPSADLDRTAHSTRVPWGYALLVHSKTVRPDSNSTAPIDDP